MVTGVPLSDGIALGHVVLHEPRVTITNFIADDVQKELKRLDDAIDTLRADVDSMLDRGEVSDGHESREVLEAYRMFAHDRGWLDRMREAVSSGLTAEAGVERVQSDTRARMLRATDPYLRERLHDLDDLANRLMRQLMGVDHAPRRINCRTTQFWLRARWGRRLCSITTASACAASCWRKAGRPRMSRSSRARSALPRSARSRMPRGIVEAGDPIIVDGAQRGNLCPPAAGYRELPMPNACGCARGGRSNIRRCATSPASPRTARPFR